MAVLTLNFKIMRNKDNTAVMFYFPHGGSDMEHSTEFLIYRALSGGALATLLCGLLGYSCGCHFCEHYIAMYRT